MSALRDGIAVISVRRYLNIFIDIILICGHLLMKLEMRSIGRGKTIVEFLSVAISVSVCI